MSEGEFWKTIEPYRWGRGNTNYKAIKKDLMRKLDPKEADALSNTFEKLKGQADRTLGDYFEKKDEWVGGDSWDDFLSHLVGLGKREYEASLSDKDRALTRYRKGDYTESFAYALPSKFDYESLDISKYIKWAQENLDAYQAVLDADDDDVPWKNKMARDLQLLVKIHRDFIRSKDYREFIGHENEAKKAAENVEKVLSRLRLGMTLPERGSIEEKLKRASNKWAVWNLFTDIQDYLL